MIINICYKFGVDISSQIYVETLNRAILERIYSTAKKSKDVNDFINNIYEIILDYLFEYEGYAVIDSVYDVQSIEETLIIIDIKDGGKVVNDLSNIETYIGTIIYGL
jgi:hypothetical protein